MLLSLSILLSLPLLAVATVPSIGNVPAYTSQRACAQSCFGDNVNGAAWVIAEHVDCTYDDPRAISNECICRIDIQPSADAWLSQCVNTQCSQNTVDIISAVSIYNAYCTDAGFGSTSSGAQATTTQPGAVSASSAAPATTSAQSQASQTSTSSSTQTSSATGNSGGNGGGLSTSDKISLGVGIGVGLPGAIVSIALIIGWCRGRRS